MCPPHLHSISWHSVDETRVARHQLRCHRAAADVSSGGPVPNGDSPRIPPAEEIFLPLATRALMTGIRPVDGLTVEQLLDALRERVTCILQEKPADLTLSEARAYEQGINDLLIRARSLVNSFHTTIRTPPEILCTISSYFTEEDLFSASQVCRHWRSVLVSSASLWTRISYNCRPGRAIASFARCGSLPIQLLLEPPFPGAFLEGVLLHGNKIVSLTVDHKPFWISQLQSLFTFSRPSVERLILHTTEIKERTPDDQGMHEIWQDFPHLRELFVASHPVPIGRFAAPNLAHLALESTIRLQEVTAQTILDMLRGCPLLETLLLNYSDTIPSITPYGHSPVRLPHLRSIEVGSREVYSGLITHLDFPLDVVTGFRHMPPVYLCGQIPLTVLASMQHVLGRIDIRYVTLAAHLWNEYLSIRFEALHGSLEITTAYLTDYRWQPTDILFSPEGVLFSHSPGIENVAEIRIIDCPFDPGKGLDHIGAAMPNVHTISIRCSTSHGFGLLTSESPAALPFPRLERVMVLGTELGLEVMARKRRDLGVPLKTVVIGRDPKGPKDDRLADYRILEELVDDLRVGCPVEIFEWEIGKEIVGFWSAAGVPESYLFVGPRTNFRFCRFNAAGDDAGSATGGL